MYIRIFSCKPVSLGLFQNPAHSFPDNLINTLPTINCIQSVEKNFFFFFQREAVPELYVLRQPFFLIAFQVEASKEDLQHLAKQHGSQPNEYTQISAASRVTILCDSIISFQTAGVFLKHPVPTVIHSYENFKPPFKKTKTFMAFVAVGKWTKNITSKSSVMKTDQDKVPGSF